MNTADTETIDRLAGCFDLSRAELAPLLGVAPDALDEWCHRGIPSERQEKVATAIAVCQLLHRKLGTMKLADVARRPTAAYGGKTMLELIEEDRHLELLQLTRDSFDWATSA
jgi:hypothetical protein